MTVEAAPELRAPKPLRMAWIIAAWGACFLGIQWGLAYAPILWFAALRALVAGGVLLAVAGVQHRPRPRGRRAWLLISALAAVNVTLAFAAMFASVAGSSTGTAAVLANAQPLLIVLPAWWWYGERISPRTVAALAAGFVGLVVVAVPGGGGQGAVLALLSAVAVTAGTLLGRRLGGLDVVAASGWHFVLGGAGLAVWAALTEGAPTISWTPGFVAVLGAMSVGGTAAAFVAWFTESRHCRLDTLTAWTFLVPVVGIVLAALVLGERPNRWTVLGLSVVLAALWLALRPRGIRPSPSGSADDRA
ncbi:MULTISPECIES: DMT family transporter [Rhodococcus]|uniref:DMT family transporter n=1 Tax=Rhodococcus TaxID=1827 RepID=UPI00057429AF|nr:MULTISPECIES: DMT family transporter [Rhodococcus]KHJ71781.1 hypothetical protein QR64_15940 [Rhodococcus sp. Chr-9]MDJ0401490.1 DMT family transporter [Rhodococcus rhodochrous]